MPEHVLIFDTTLRDGEQAPGFSMSPEGKLQLARQLEALGVDVIEAGFPISSAADFAGVEAVARTCRRARVAALARAVEGDIRRAAEALRPAARPRLHVFVATSDLHLKHKLRKSREQVLEDTLRAVALARSLVADVEFSAEDATRSDQGFLQAVLERAVEAGAATLNLPDTVGYSTPADYGALFRAMRARVRGAERVTWSTHCHNDLGLAVANTLAGLEAGARQIECTVNGIGERAGNAALEEVAMALRVRGDALPFTTGIAHAEIYATSAMLTATTGVAVQPNKAIVGRNAFAHEAGIHQDGVLKSPLTYEIMTPEAVGAPGRELVLGKHSGRHALRHRLAGMGYALEGAELDRAYAALLAEAAGGRALDEGALARLARGAGAAAVA